MATTTIEARARQIARDAMDYTLDPGEGLYLTASNDLVLSRTHPPYALCIEDNDQDYKYSIADTNVCIPELIEVIADWLDQR
ncbi:MAG: hypothetical protein D6692_04025 [Planctomycetota bacterium]|nr:MAG: hypothetical protein D6692_04025 [Planctomycetota bacterium]